MEALVRFCKKKLNGFPTWEIQLLLRISIAQYILFSSKIFTISLLLFQVYEAGSIFDPTILDITDDDLKKSIMTAVRNVAAISLSIGYPTIASVPHSIVNGMKKCMAIAAVTDITFKEAEMMKEYLADPSKFASAVAAAAPAAGAGGAAPAEEAKKEESAEESDDDMGFGLFD